MLLRIGVTRRTGELVVRSSDAVTEIRIAFVNGMIVGALSPRPADTLTRIALSGRMISPAMSRMLGKTEDIDRLAGMCNLTASQVWELKHRALIQRVGRSFAIDHGSYEVLERITIPTMLGIELDVRAATYHGIRHDLSQDRLTRTLRALGSRFVMRADETALARFGFAEDERRVVFALRSGTSLSELSAIYRDIDERMVESVFCALALCGLAEPTTQAPSFAPRSMRPRTAHEDPPLARIPRATSNHLEDPVVAQASKAVRPPELTTEEVKRLIRVGACLLERDVDHFTFLGLRFGATVEEVRDAYREFARYLRPERLAALGISDDRSTASIVFAQVVLAYTVLSDPARRHRYMTALSP